MRERGPIIWCNLEGPRHLSFLLSKDDQGNQFEWTFDNANPAPWLMLQLPKKDFWRDQTPYPKNQGHHPLIMNVSNKAPMYKWQKIMCAVILGVLLSGYQVAGIKALVLVFVQVLYGSFPK